MVFVLSPAIIFGKHLFHSKLKTTVCLSVLLLWFRFCFVSDRRSANFSTSPTWAHRGDGILSLVSPSHLFIPCLPPTPFPPFSINSLLLSRFSPSPFVLGRFVSLHVGGDVWCRRKKLCGRGRGGYRASSVGSGRSSKVSFLRLWWHRQHGVSLVVHLFKRRWG